MTPSQNDWVGRAYHKSRVNEQEERSPSYFAHAPPPHNNSGAQPPRIKKNPLGGRRCFFFSPRGIFFFFFAAPPPCGNFFFLSGPQGGTPPKGGAPCVPFGDFPPKGPRGVFPPVCSLIPARPPCPGSRLAFGVKIRCLRPNRIFSKKYGLLNPCRRNSPRPLGRVPFEDDFDFPFWHPNSNRYFSYQQGCI